MLAAEKKKCYAGWNELKANRVALLTAKSNAGRTLSITPDALERNEHRERHRYNSHDR